MEDSITKMRNEPSGKRSRSRPAKKWKHSWISTHKSDKCLSISNQRVNIFLYEFELSHLYRTGKCFPEKRLWNVPTGNINKNVFSYLTCFLWCFIRFKLISIERCEIWTFIAATLYFCNTSLKDNSLFLSCR